MPSPPPTPTSHRTSPPPPLAPPLAPPQATVTVEVDSLDYFAPVTRAVLDEAARPLCRGIEALAERAMAEAGISSDGVHALLLAGGGARMAAVQGALAALAPRAALHFAPTAEESVVRGAAAYAAMLSASNAAAADAAPAAGSAAAARGVVRRAPLLPRALAMRDASGGLAVLAHARTPLPLSRTLSLGLPAAGAAALLTLLELPPAADADADADADGAPAGEAQGRTLVQLKLGAAPASSSRLQLHLCRRRASRVPRSLARAQEPLS